MENLDSMTRDELLAFAQVYSRPQRVRAQHLVGHRPGYIRAVKDLANYASNKATAMYCRERGDINGAMMYESICDRIYNKLPQFARW
jgi:hypothetical protein